MTEPMFARRWRVLLFGDPKLGKTSLAETAPGPRLFLDAEGGTNWMSTRVHPWNPLEGPPPEGLGPEDTVVVKILDWNLLERLNNFLQTGNHPFRSVILDSITELQKRAKRLILETGSAMRQQDWGALYDRMDPVLREIRDLTERPGSPVECVVFVALAVTKDNKIVPDIQGAAQRSLQGQVDTLAYLRPGLLTADGQQERELLVDARENVGAGDRTKVLRRGFPGGIIPIHLDDETDTLQWNLTQLLTYMNQ